METLSYNYICIQRFTIMYNFANHINYKIIKPFQEIQMNNPCFPVCIASYVNSNSLLKLIWASFGICKLQKVLAIYNKNTLGTVS